MSAALYLIGFVIGAAVVCLVLWAQSMPKADPTRRFPSEDDVV